MALTKCPECGKENVSESAESCPSCGYGINSHFKNKKLQEQKEIENQKQKQLLEQEKQKKEIEIEQEKLRKAKKNRRNSSKNWNS